MLSGKKRLAFALRICERQFPVLEKFGAEVQFDRDEYRRCLDLAWNVFGADADYEPDIDFCELAESCLNHAPDTENFDHELTSAALNCILSISIIMKELCGLAVDHISDVAQMAYDTVNMSAQILEGRSFITESSAVEIGRNPIVQAELKRQEEDVELLERDVRLDTIEQLTSYRRIALNQDPILPLL